MLINEVLIGHGVRGQRSSRGCGLRFADGKQEARNQRKAGILWALLAFPKAPGGQVAELDLGTFPTALPEGRESRGAGTLWLVPFSREIEELGQDTHPGD